MASLRQTGTNVCFLVLFRFSGRRFQRALKTNQRKEALAQITRIDDLITLIERGLVMSVRKGEAPPQSPAVAR